MNVTFSCPRCEQSGRVDFDPAAGVLPCPNCHQQIVPPADAFEDGQLCRCLVCASRDMFVRKDFPQRLGVGLVVLGVVGSSIAWGYSLPLVTFGILFATALADVILYAVVPDALMCYRCHAQYRLAAGHERHGVFNLETHERYRQQSARLAAPRRS